MATGALPQTWDLDAIFPGGSDSTAFAAFLDELGADLDRLGEAIREGSGGNPVERLARLAGVLQRVGARLKEADAFAACLAAQNLKDRKATVLVDRIRALAARYESHFVRFDRLLAELREDEWNGCLRHPALAEVAFVLEERRSLALMRMAPEMEELAGDLAVDGYHGWFELYDTAVAKMEIPYEEDGRTTLLSVAQAANKLHHPSRETREKVFRSWEEAWARQADYCAAALNRLGGFRLRLYRHRGWRSVLKEPLLLNRMSEETLRAMWDAVERNRGFLLRYFDRKARLLGVERLSWHDVEAPLAAEAVRVSYDEGAALILERFREFSPKMAAFSETAFRNRWIEAENRSGKRPGGFCASFPIKKQSRIFMTYDGTMNNVATLAHELGHAFHQHVMDDLPPFVQNYAMNVAETASTFAELIVADAAVRSATDRRRKLALLDEQIQRAVAFLMNIHARFLFESRFYEEREKGMVSVEALNELMLEAQRRAFHGALAGYHPHFWASKLHFYITDIPFYNFPYTFGYLFSSGLYERARGEGKSFENRYIALLRDTGRMTAEELAKKHLGVDLTKPDFWEQSMARVKRDVDAFLALAPTS